MPSVFLVHCNSVLDRRDIARIDVTVRWCFTVCLRNRYCRVFDGDFLGAHIGERRCLSVAIAGSPMEQLAEGAMRGFGIVLRVVALVEVIALLFIIVFHANVVPVARFVQTR